LFLRIAHRKKFQTEAGLESLTDAEVIDNYRKSGDQSLIVVLFERYTHLVFGICMKYLKNEEDAKDAVMQIFENLVDNLHKHEIRNFKSWLYSVARNHCLMKIREEASSNEMKKNIREKILQDVMEFPGDYHPMKAETDHDSDENLYKAISRLNHQQRQCIELIYLQNKSYVEVSEITGYTMNEVKSYIQNGKRNLKIYLEKRDE
jgi:RNA polymerase sigma factor (sigma-70 family)